MLPAQQHFHAHQAAVAHAEDRLVGQAQLAALPGAAQLLFHVHATLDRVVHRPAVVAVAVLAGHLRLVHGDVAVLQQRGGVGGVVRVQRHPDRGAQEQLPALHHQRLAQLAHQHFGQQAGIGGHVTIAHQDHEFVATEAGQQGVIAARLGHGLADALGELQQCFVARLMAQGVVDPLEIVDVGEQQAQPVLGCARGHQPVVQRLAEGQAIGQPGQRIGVGHVPHFAVVAGDGIAHAGEAAHQLAHFVVAGVFQQRRLVIAGFDAARRRGQIADRRHQGALHVQDDRHPDDHQQAQHQQQPTQVAAADLLQALAHSGTGGQLARLHLVQGHAHADAADTLLAEQDGHGVVEHGGRLLHHQALRGHGRGRHRVVHRLAEAGHVGRAVMHQPALGIEHPYIAHNLLPRGRAHQCAHLAQIVVVQRVGQRIGQLARQCFATAAHAAVEQFMDDAATEALDLALHRRLAPQQHRQDRHHHQHCPTHREQETGLHSGAEPLHSTTFCTRLDSSVIPFHHCRTQPAAGRCSSAPAFFISVNPSTRYRARRSCCAPGAALAARARRQGTRLSNPHCVALHEADTSSSPQGIQTDYPKK